MSFNCISENKYVEGAIAVKFLIKMHKARLTDVFFWLNRFFNNYEDIRGEVKSPDYNHRLSDYNPYSYFFEADEIVKFIPTIDQQIISKEDLIFKRYDYKNSNVPQYFKDYQEDEISHIIEHNIENGNLFAIDGSEFSMHFAANQQHFLIRGELQAIEEKYDFSLNALLDMDISNKYNI